VLRWISVLLLLLLLASKWGAPARCHTFHVGLSRMRTLYLDLKRSQYTVNHQLSRARSSKNIARAAAATYHPGAMSARHQLMQGSRDVKWAETSSLVEPRWQVDYRIQAVVFVECSLVSMTNQIDP